MFIITIGTFLFQNVWNHYLDKNDNDPLAAVNEFGVDFRDNVDTPFFLAYAVEQMLFASFVEAQYAEFAAAEEAAIVEAGAAEVVVAENSVAPTTGAKPQMMAQPAQLQQAKPVRVPGYGWKDARWWKMVKRLQEGESLEVNNLRIAAELRKDAFPDFTRSRYRGLLSEAPDLTKTYDWHNPQKMILACSPNPDPSVMKDPKAHFDKGVFHEQEATAAFGRTDYQEVAGCGCHVGLWQERR